MKKYIKHILVTALSLWLLMPTLFAQPVPKNSNPVRLVVDQAGLLSNGEIQYLEQELIAFSDSTSNQIVVVTMKDFEGYDKWEVAQNIGQTWGVGNKEDNGVVILIKPKTPNSKGEIAIQVGYGLEGAIPDATGKMIVENDMIPYFKQERMFDGIESGIQIIKGLAVGEFNSDAYANNSNGGGGSFMPFIFILFVFFFAVVGRLRSAKSYSVGHNVPFWTAMMLMSQTRGHGGSYNNFTSGGGGFGGGGFGGFGGGGFGGGGAGGSW
jgi:uncharacterized protein